MEKTDIGSLLPEELALKASEMGLEKYRVKQIFSWVARGAESFSEMTDLPKGLRERLEGEFSFRPVRAENVLVSKTDGTRKYLFSLFDGERAEGVLLNYQHGYSVCLSTQVGCKMGCAFCASTKAGFCRDLAASEILGQMHAVTRDMRRTDPDFRIGHVVLMGIGEPLDNFDQVTRFLKLVNHPDSFGIGYRNLSLSTCGIVPRIRDLADLDLPITLSVSLHAADNGTRSRLMPVNRRYPLEELMRAVKDYIAKTGRRVSFEYTVIRGENDSMEDAARLARLLKGLLCHVNLIPVNPTRETAFSPGTADRIRDWIAFMEKEGIPATRRRTLGADIAAACGQLRREKQIEEQA